jgi:putative N6-adenine-specific DNA methylase
MNDLPLALFAVAAPGTEAVVRAELAALGALSPEIVTGGVAFNGDAETMMRVNLWSRTASRVLLRIACFPAPNLRALASGAARVPWGDWLAPPRRLHVKATCHASRVYHSGAAAERVLEAACAATGCAPAADSSPSAGSSPAAASGDAAAAVLVRLERDVCTISLDTSGAHLHLRAWRLETAKAPLRENLAAAVLLQSGWDGAEALLDPMCGSGTFPVEAALLAARVPPGSARRFAFMDWPGFDADPWARLLDAAAGQRRPPPCPIRAADRDAGAVEITQRNAARAGVEELIEVERRALSATPALPGPGLIVCNPPYGGRLGRPADLRDLYAALGAVVRRMSGWRATVVTTEPRLAAACGLPFAPPGPPISHGGLRLGVYRTGVSE